MSEFAGTRFDPLELRDIVRWARERGTSAPFAYVVTPNVDHVVRLDRLPAEHPAHAAYRDAAISVCDSQILRALGRIGGLRLAIVRGSDLTATLLKSLPEGSRLAVIGGDAASLAALRRLVPHASIAHHVPPMGLLANPTAMDAAAEFIEANPAEYIFLAVGSPQQELLAHRTLKRGRATGSAFCIGAAIEFALGQKRRAPGWMQASGLEWLFRLLTEPARLWRRYLVDDIRILPITLRWLLQKR